MVSEETHEEENAKKDSNGELEIGVADHFSTAVCKSGTR